MATHRASQLDIWQRSHRLALSIYRHTKTFPPEELNGITAQLRRAAMSVPLNISEGSKKRSNVEYARCLNVAEGALAEAEYLLILSRDLGFIADETTGPLLTEVSAVSTMLTTLRQRVGGPT